MEKAKFLGPMAPSSRPSSSKTKLKIKPALSFPIKDPMKDK